MKYYVIKATFTYSHYYNCGNCRAGYYGHHGYNDEPKLDSSYDADEKFSVTRTIFYPIDNIKEFMDEYKDYITPNLSFLNSFPKYDELEKMAIGKYIDEEDVCDNSYCNNGEPNFGGYDNAKITSYESECIAMELIEYKKGNL